MNVWIHLQTLSLLKMLRQLVVIPSLWSSMVVFVFASCPIKRLLNWIANTIWCALSFNAEIQRLDLSTVYGSHICLRLFFMSGPMFWIHFKVITIWGSVKWLINGVSNTIWWVIRSFRFKSPGFALAYYCRTWDFHTWIMLGFFTVSG